ncbi:hypothetical protein GUITHDRAFT_152390 [Guillardia theta CCMP2712]|uniref:Uncharacterized protein n=1 Tax=Guillardia theta (strain CCMP2712) TaxID=905079 RepID=L1JDW3_GUITC|nr:hypothetical protein GUITHDRAFT_152390 [Guillardia theta CCMP2712]EKX46507.1 hypothetical protein GUITHDRAFT_152390 [Guillardia theta CCMP2712]|mmetsp:Transcript_48239/g.151316  ORF Transcript_48239/g.151316 Transcript_48239/m.151316 type:complete len:158 (-) Transcript_48239:509-982(-)|eukprot:XP_005833487.1 hypothetical protein GUITHDRAFT_152390 [Guillardia theta CCMP2712]
MPESSPSEVLVAQEELAVHICEAQEKVQKDIIAKMIFDPSPAPRLRLAAGGEGAPASPAIEEPFARVSESAEKRNPPGENQGVRRRVGIGCNQRQGLKVDSDPLIYSPVSGWEQNGREDEETNCFIPWIDLFLPASSPYGLDRNPLDQVKPLREWNF